MTSFMNSTLLLLSAMLLAPLVAVTADPATITVQAGQRLGRIEPLLHGQFIEHLGHCINGGIFEPGSPLSDPNGFRRDVLEKVRELNPPLLRWPGGTFTKIYHWQDGVGPKPERRRRPNLIWGGEEDNLFGTDEFIRYCREIGAAPYLSVNMATGTAEEAANWVEYCNGSGNTHYANLRRKHGFPEPHGVRFWGLGNEEEAEPDCGRLQDPAEYAKEAWQFAKLMKLQDPGIQLIVAGVGNNPHWNTTVLNSLHPVADYLSAHWYLRANDYPGLLGRVAGFELQLKEFESFLGSYPVKPEKFSHWYRFPPRQGPVKLAIDEWGLWQGGTRRDDLWGLNQTYTWQDALAVASWLNAMRRHPGVIGLATWAQMVNVIAPIQTDAKGSVRQTVFHPLALYARHSGHWSLAAHCESPPLAGEAKPALPALDVSATGDDVMKQLTLAVVNRHPESSIAARLEIAGGDFALLEGCELTAASLLVSNSVERPGEDCVRTRQLAVDRVAGSHEFPPRSVTLLIFGSR